MRVVLRAVVVCGYIALMASAAGAQAPKPIQCSIQQVPPVFDADRAFAAGDWKHADELYQSQLAKAGSDWAYAGAVRAELEQNKLSEAMTTAGKAVAAMPSSADAQALMADVLLRMGQVADAGAGYAKAVQANPCSARAQFGFARVSALLSNHATAKQKLTAAHTLAPGDPEITVAFLETQPEEQRQSGLRRLLANQPILAPSVVHRLADELAALEAHKTCTATQEVASAKLELMPLMSDGVYERSWGLSVRLNDAATPLLDLDSSISGIVLNPKDAQKAGVHALGTAPAPADAEYMAVADKVQIGALEYHDCPVRVVPAAVLANGNSVIGTDFFRDHLIHIDYVAKLVTLSPLPAPPAAGGRAAAVTDRYVAPEEKDWVPVYIAGANILLPTLVSKKGPYLFLLDTGTNRTILAPDLVSNVLLSQKDATINLMGTSGSFIKVMPRDGGGNLNTTSVRDPEGNLLPVRVPLKLPVIRIAGVEFSDGYAISFDISRKSHEVGLETSGVLGFRNLRSYFLDLNYRDGLVRMQWDPNQRYEARQREKRTLSLEY